MTLLDHDRQQKYIQAQQIQPSKYLFRPPRFQLAASFRQFWQPRQLGRTRWTLRLEWTWYGRGVGSGSIIGTSIGGVNFPGQLELLIGLATA